MKPEHKNQPTTSGQPEPLDVYDELKESLDNKDYSHLPPPPKEGLLPKYSKSEASPKPSPNKEQHRHNTKHEKHPLLSLAAKITIITGALAGCTGHREVAPITPNVATASDGTDSNLSAKESRFSAEAFTQGELISPEQTQLIVELTGIDEIKNLKGLRFVDKATTSHGKNIQIISINEAGPFASLDQILDTINKYEAIAEQGKQLTVNLEIDSANTIAVPFNIQLNPTQHKFIFFGDNNFRISQAMPETYGRYTNTYAITRDGATLGLEGSATFITDTESQKVGSTGVNSSQTSLTVETCQSTIDIKVSEEFRATIQSVKTQNPKLTEGRINNLGQELVCNSFGFAKAAKLEGKTYEQYLYEEALIPDVIYAPLSITTPVVDSITYARI